MKILTGVLIAVALMTVWQLRAEEPKTYTAGLGVFSVHEVRLKPGVSPEEFENFVLNVWNPPYNDEVQGMHIYLTKGDRGVRTGEYAFVVAYSSLEDRNRVYPPGGKVSEDRLKIRKREGRPQQWARFNELSEGLGDTFTDYVVITPKLPDRK